MTQTMPEKLELIAKCIRDRREVEAYEGINWIVVEMPDRTGDCVIFGEYEYRALKPLD